jgi:hypothetical protein
MLVRVMLMSSPAHGMVYMWRDSAGITHYTNKEYDVPSRYKAKVKTLYPEASDSGTVQPSPANVQAVTVAQPPAISNQNAGAAVEPVMPPTAPTAQIQSTQQRIPGRGRRHRARIADVNE